MRDATLATTHVRQYLGSRTSTPAGGSSQWMMAGHLLQQELNFVFNGSGTLTIRLVQLKQAHRSVFTTQGYQVAVVEHTRSCGSGVGAGARGSR